MAVSQPSHGIGLSISCVILLAVPLVVSNLVSLAKAADPEPNKEISSEQVAHGKYLVHHVAQCIECHTPRDSKGDLNMTRLLQGAPIPMEGPRFVSSWAAESASIAGLGNYDHEFVKHLLTKGQRPNGSKPKSPMPRFRLSESDAEAVIAYLSQLRFTAQ